MDPDEHRAATHTFLVVLAPDGCLVGDPGPSPTGPHSAPRFPPLSTTSPHFPPQSGRDPSLDAIRLGFRDDPRPDLRRAGVRATAVGQLPGGVARAAWPPAGAAVSGSGPASRPSRALRRPPTCTAHWNRAPARVRRWLMPTSLPPPASTSPGPTPAKHTSGHHPVHAIAPRCTRHAVEHAGDVLAEPHHRRRRRRHRPRRRAAARVGTTTSNHTSPPGSTSTTPATAAPPHDLDACRRARGDVEHVLALRRAEHDRRPVDLEHPHLRPRVVADRPGVELAAEPSAGANVRTRWPGTASTPRGPGRR